MTPNAQDERNVFASNFNRLLLSHGKTQSDVVEDLGITASTVSDWAKAKKYPRVDKMQMLAAYFGVPISELREAPNPRRTDVVRIPVVGSVIAGIPAEAVEDIVDWEEIPANMAARGDYIGLRVRGNSMEPRICEGDTVIIRRQKTIENGELAVVFVNGDEATLKRVKIVDGGIILVAYNSAVYEPHFYSRQQIRDLPVQIYGKVVELRGKF